jgi:hypothetical protein
LISATTNTDLILVEEPVGKKGEVDERKVLRKNNSYDTTTSLHSTKR